MLHAPSMDTAATFEELFGAPAELQADAPGRVNLIGEHTDYNGGFVLPTAIPQRTSVALRRRADNVVRVHSANLHDLQQYTLGMERPGRGWADYVQGVTAVLLRDHHTLGGVDLWVKSEVPLGSGLSSSAALEVALLRALRQAFGLKLDDVALALAAQRVETEFVGAPVGVMDQMASSLADTGTALFLDTRTLAFRRVAIPPALEVVVIDSGVSHSHVAGDYRRRRQECEAAAALLGVHQLRDLRETELSALARLPDVLRRRARHVVTENARVHALVAAFEEVRLEAIGGLLAASHASMRDDFEVSVPETDLLVELAVAQPEILGARLTGGGFGGSIVALAAAGRGRAAAERVASEYRRRTAKSASVLLPPA